MSKDKTPINEDGTGNCCPKCSSLQISKDMQYAIVVEKDLNTGKDIIRDNDGKRIHKPSNKLLARLYKTNREVQMWIYRCRKCGWTSETFVP